ncbi:MAG: amidohydrolase 2 [Verrucomicrobiaceae bacterium]|nr:amidohydrolase 2 [Verrucomicrobiaceae bacterium]
MKTRRDTLKLFLATLAAAPLAGAESLSPPVAVRIVDAQTQFYDPTRPQGVPWPEKDSPLYHSAYPKDWLAAASPLGVRETIVVECSKWPQDNDWILNLAAKEKSILGFIGRLQPGTADFPKELKRLAANPIFRGIRVDGDDLRNNISTAEFATNARLLADMDLVLELNGLDDLEPIARLADRVPSLRIVLEHLGNPGDPQNLRAGWKDGITALSKRRNVTAKVTGLAGAGSCRPVLDHAWEAFGDERLLFGSGWPVASSGTSYAGLFSIVAEFFKTKGGEACEKFFWKNSQAAYKWVDRA